MCLGAHGPNTKLKTGADNFPLALTHLMPDRRIARASHLVINAWRCPLDTILHQGASPHGNLVRTLSSDKGQVYRYCVEPPSKGL